MKKILTILACLTSFFAAAQQYKIVVSYDENGNRLLREKICYEDCQGGKPAPPQDSTSSSGNAKDAGSAIAGLDIINGTGFELFPNPTTGNLTLRLGSVSMLSPNCELLISDAAGRVMFRKKVTEQISHYDIGANADGFYFCTLLWGDKRETVRIVKKTK